PIAGPVQDPSYLDRVLAVLRKDASQNPLIPDDTWQPGLYVLGGLGSKGLATAPLLAEYVADLLTGQPTSLDIDLVSRIHPARFQVRALMRQQR
ncbi:MAG: bifunctional tRNA (5-methylaminomethyl-2-thiouridine)(34)-methyltransferase MnmD/FAD-dependent 5-carboxymethylaminomethyl-2-thiouridine(34) oxidoreductase MnmC, partial [Gammaproteobacteria bacterium]|nr:bifunctional tRNA (5-methylaminomethyl-2-thiouridine)(34)-methyltransferase MnmD/FAD-dependent 5-carboxymethylaminomethyl-2-thiouridine(34) oxidoreductase MnmC [Gammaproteobacteria bacterium]